MSYLHFNDLNDFFLQMGLPPLKFDHFYIVNYSEHKINHSHKIKAYTHEFFEFSLAIGYDAWVSINEHKINVSKHNMWFVSPGQLTKWDMVKKEKNAFGFSVFFKPEILTYNAYNVYDKFPFFKNYNLGSLKVKDPLNSHYMHYLKQMDKEYKLHNNESLDFIKAYLNILLNTVKREWQNASENQQIMTHSQKVVFNLEEMIRSTEQKYKPVSFYAQKLNISPIYLSECVKKSTGKTAKQIIDEYTILAAKSILKHSFLSISEVAYKLGFDDISNFVKYFKKRSGLTPKQYLKTDPQK